jgi:hypothetical protein
MLLYLSVPLELTLSEHPTPTTNSIKDPVAKLDDSITDFRNKTKVNESEERQLQNNITCAHVQ